MSSLGHKFIPFSDTQLFKRAQALIWGAQSAVGAVGISSSIISSYNKRMWSEPFPRYTGHNIFMVTMITDSDKRPTCYFYSPLFSAPGVKSKKNKWKNKLPWPPAAEHGPSNLPLFTGATAYVKDDTNTVEVIRSWGGCLLIEFAA